MLNQKIDYLEDLSCRFDSFEGPNVRFDSSEDWTCEPLKPQKMGLSAPPQNSTFRRSMNFGNFFQQCQSMYENELMCKILG